MLFETQPEVQGCDLCSIGMLHSVYCYWFSDVSGQPTAPIFNGEVAKEETWECIVYGTHAYHRFERWAVFEQHPSSIRLLFLKKKRRVDPVLSQACNNAEGGRKLALREVLLPWGRQFRTLPLHYLLRNINSYGAITPPRCYRNSINDTRIRGTRLATVSLQGISGCATDNHVTRTNQQIRYLCPLLFTYKLREFAGSPYSKYTTFVG